MNETVFVERLGKVEVRYSERGTGQPILLLHGGGGPASVVPWAQQLAHERRVRIITPTHPGLAGTRRPESLTDVRGLALVYAALLEKLGLDGVSVIGHSIGGWIAAELALVARDRIRSVVLIDAVGIDVPEHPAADVFGGEPTTQEWRVLKMYAGTMMDPSLRPRLSASTFPPTLVLWGERDSVVDREYGRAYAGAIRGAELEVLSGVGHSPQMEAPDQVSDIVGQFVARHASRGAPASSGQR